MEKIIARLKLNSNKTWEVTTRTKGGKRKLKKTAIGAYRVIENRLLKAVKDALGSLETTVRVDYDQSCHNMSTESYSVIDTLYALTCFMEDYLPPKFMGDRVSKYLLKNTLS